MSSSDTTTIKGIFANSTMLYIFAFLAIYIIVYFLLQFFYNAGSQTDGTVRLVRILDIIVLLFIIIYIAATYATMSMSNIWAKISDYLKSWKDFAENPYSIFTVLVFIVVLYASIYAIRLPMTDQLKPVSIFVIENVALILFVVLLIIDFFKYVLNIDLLTYMDKITNYIDSSSTDDNSATTASATTASTTTASTTTTKPKKDSTGNYSSTTTDTTTGLVFIKNPSSTAGPSSTSGPSSTERPIIGGIITNKHTTTNTGTCSGDSNTGVNIPGGEVFNIRNNLYTYDEAKEVCSIYGATLATYDQIEDAYNDGGEWCNYGWSDGQMALFPTQKSTWNSLQGSSLMKDSCGRPGINGGIIKNKNVRFGVNCYGRKPIATENETALMKANVSPSMPLSREDQELQAKINVWQQNSDKFLVINSFNKQKWSEQ